MFDKKLDNFIVGLAGFAVVSLLGTLLHFVYDWFGGNFSALFSGVNESTWEHMKLLFFPMFAVAIIENFFFKHDYKNFWCIKLLGTLLGLIMIPVLFYTIGGIFGKTPDFVNIGIFFVSAAAAYIYETKSFSTQSEACKYNNSAFFAFCIIAIAFWAFTFFPPKIPLFQDPINGSYGI